MRIGVLALQGAFVEHEQVLAIAREIGARRGEGNRLGNLGLATKRRFHHRLADVCPYAYCYGRMELIDRGKNINYSDEDLPICEDNCCNIVFPGKRALICASL